VPDDRRAVAAVLLADLVSTFGSEMTGVALPWFVLVTTGSPARMAGVMAAEFVGIAVLGILGGRATHGLGSRRTLLAGDAVRAPLLLLVPVLYWAGALHYAVLLIVGLVVGAWFPAYSSAQRMLLAVSAGDDDVRLTRLGGAFGALNETASFLGPAAGGALVAIVGAPWALVADAVTYAVAFALVAVVVPAAYGGVAGPPAPLAAGLRYLRGDRPVRRQLAAVMVNGIAWTALMAALPVVARRRYNGSAALAGTFVAAYGAGSVVGGLVSTRSHTAGGRRPGWSFVALAGVTWLLVPRAPAAVVVLGVAAIGVCNGVYFPRLFSALTLRPPVALRPAVMTAAQSAMSATSPVGFVAAGLLLERASVTSAFLLVAGAATVGAALSVTGEPLRSGVDVEGHPAQEADEGETDLGGQVDGERRRGRHRG
jgi:MFS family permease